MNKENNFKTKKNKNFSVLELQKQLIDILKVFDNICKKNNIEYFLIDDTCLEAINSQGITKNTTSINLGIERKNYDKLLNIISSSLPNEYIASSFELDSKYTLISSAMRIGKKNTYLKRKKWTSFSHTKFHGISIDIQVFDYTSSNKIIRFTHNIFSKLWLFIIFLFDLVYINLVFLKKLYMIYQKNVSNHYLKKGSKILKVNSLKKTKCYKENDIYPLRQFSYENIDALVFNDYENILKRQYGDYKKNNYLSKIDITTLSFTDGKDTRKSPRGFYYAIILGLIALILFGEFSFPFLGFAILVLGITLLYYINYKEK